MPAGVPTNCARRFSACTVARVRRRATLERSKQSRAVAFEEFGQRRQAVLVFGGASHETLGVGDQVSKAAAVEGVRHGASRD